MKGEALSVLRFGRDNAISFNVLADSLTHRSMRDLQKQIEREWSADEVILSDPCGGGYYLSNDPEKLLRFTRTLTARARNTIRVVQTAQRALGAATGQESMQGWYDG